MNEKHDPKMVRIPPYIGEKPLVGRYYMAECERCGWLGSSSELTDDCQCTREVDGAYCLGHTLEVEPDQLFAIIQAMGKAQADLVKLHGGELGLPKEGWPVYHKRKMETLRDLTAGHYERKLAKATDYVQRMVDCAGDQPSLATGYLRDILDVLTKSISAEPSAREARALQAEKSLGIERLPPEPSNDLCAESAHEFVPFHSECVKCGEPYSAETSAPKLATVNGHKLNCKAVDEYKPGECSCGHVDASAPALQAVRAGMLGDGLSTLVYHALLPNGCAACSHMLDVRDEGLAKDKPVEMRCKKMACRKLFEQADSATSQPRTEVREVKS